MIGTVDHTASEGFHLLFEVIEELLVHNSLIAA